MDAPRETQQTMAERCPPMPMSAGLR
ncbi:hypothetical protein FRIGORI9N_470039 [Frigoribacterium sp. 9N]|nr:hypothetical protein FRIGORI9N_470039 [Frigoribacterium sp. 9N]